MGLAHRFMCLVIVEAVEPEPVRPHHDVQATRCSELAHEGGDACLHRRCGHDLLFRDLGIGLAPTQRGQRQSLTLGEGGHLGGRPAGAGGHAQVTHGARGHHVQPTVRGTHRVGERVRIHSLEEEAVGAACDSITHGTRSVERGSFAASPSAAIPTTSRSLKAAK